MAAFLADHDIPGVTQELRHLEEATRTAAGPDAADPEPSSLLRRQIARRCVYGLDINPVAVELARVSIWIHTFVRGLPMSSLDHNLVCANSLTGIGSVDEALDVLVEGRKGNQLTVFDGPIEDALDTARDVLTDVAAAAEATRPEAEASARAVQRAKAAAGTARLLFDAAVLKRIGHDGLVAATEPAKMAALAAEPAAQEVVRALNPAHFPYLFPEVFLRARSGFDVVIGNPPWETIKVETHKWWALRFPGLQSMATRDRDTRITELRSQRPDLDAEFAREIEVAGAFRDALHGLPYPGLGTGDLDLYEVFAWRMRELLGTAGYLGVVFPRQLLASGGTAEWRRVVLGNGELVDTTLLLNNRRWAFGNIHPQWTIALIVLERAASHPTFTTSGPFASARSSTRSRCVGRSSQPRPAVLEPVGNGSVDARRRRQEDSLEDVCEWPGTFVIRPSVGRTDLQRTALDSRETAAVEGRSVAVSVAGLQR